MPRRIRRWAVLVAMLAACGSPESFAAEALPDSSPSAILVDRVVSLSRLEALDGSPGADRASLPRWRQAVFELRRAAERDLGWRPARAVQDAALAAIPRNRIPIGLLHAAYDRLDPSGGSERAEVFAIAPLRRVNYFPLDTRFSIPREAYLSHGVDPPVALDFDAGDGLGLRPIRFDEAIDVRYSRGGEHRLGLRATFPDGSVRHAYARLDVIDGPAPPPPTETWMVTATEEWQGVAGSGLAYLYLAEGRTELTNPVVVIEGFDIDNSIDWPVLYELLNQENLLEDLRAMGYDAVVLDFDEAVEPIQRNAYVFTRLVEMILGEIDPGQDMALVGASMGGLVGRYGLLWLEDQAIAHRVRNFISFDAPHGGANIPLGLQHWVDFFSGQSDEAAFFLERLNSDAARQMLLYHVGSTAGTTAAPDPLLAAFDADVDALGDWPQSPRLSAIINGSGAMQDQGFDAGEQILEWTHRSFAVDIDGNVWAVPDGGSQVIFEGLVDIIFLPAESEMITIAGTLPWDNAPGGFRPTMQQLADAESPYGDIVALHPAHGFIPSVSALALDTANPFHDIAGDANLLDGIPFDAAYFPALNQEHIDITPENKAWFITEIGFGVPADMIFADGFEQPQE